MVGSEVCSGDHSGAVFIHNKRNRRHKVCDRQKIACHIIYSMMGTQFMFLSLSLRSIHFGITITAVLILWYVFVYT